MTNREDELLANIGQSALNTNANSNGNVSSITTVNNRITVDSATLPTTTTNGDLFNTNNNNNNINNHNNNKTLSNGIDTNIEASPTKSLKLQTQQNNTLSINTSDIETATGTTGIKLSPSSTVTAATSPTSTTNSTTATSTTTTTLATTNDVPAVAVVLNEFWSNENPPSSASSGFSDDDSLAGQEGDPKTIEQIVQMVKERGRQGLIAEYTDIRGRAPDGTFIHARLRNNLNKNRYTDVLCYDHSRVVLSREDGDEMSDYINANFVDGYKQKNAYISTQGPLPKTSQDFWRMIWEQHCLVIVMTTRVMERGRVKCGQYWEPSEDSSLEFGNFHLRTLGVETSDEYTVSTLELKNLKTEEVRNISHWQFTSWPDYGVPSSAMAMINFLQKVRSQQAQMVKALGDTWAGHSRGPPIVVHCSAGIGRTGTFITLDICISRLEDVGTADIRGTVEKIRSQRAYSIQMPDQYVFCHLALIEYAISSGMLQSADLTGFDEREDESE